MSAPAPEENLMNLGDRLLWGMENYGVSTELFGATAYVGFNLALDPKDNYWYCDGTADDVQINAAEAYATVLGGGTVELERGTYVLVDPIVPTGGDIWYKGQGSDTIIDGDGLATGEHAFVISGAAEIKISNMAIQTEDGGGKTCHCIFIEDGSNNFHIEDVLFINSDDNGIHIEGTTITQGHIHNCHFADADGNGIYVHMDDANYMYRLHIIDCDIINTGGAGIYFDATTGGYAYFVIEGNSIFNPTGIGIFVDDGNQGQIIGNHCLVGSLSGIHIVGSSELNIADNICVGNERHGIFLSVSTQCLVDGNTCNENDGLDSNTYDGINLDTSATDCTVINNTCERNYNRGIAIRGPRNQVVANWCVENDRQGIWINQVDCQINDNYVADNGQDGAGTYHGIHLSTSAGNCQIDGNYVDGFGDSQEDGIYLETTVHECQITGNYCSDGMGSGITLEDDNDYILILGNYLHDNDDYGIEIITANSSNATVKNNYFLGNGAPVDLNGTNIKMHEIVLPFVQGTTFLSDDTAASIGWEIDAATEFAATMGWLPNNIFQVMHLSMWGVSLVAEAGAMRIQVMLRAGLSNEAYDTEDVTIASHPSDTTNFAVGDVVYWFVTPADDSDLGDLIGGDAFYIKAEHAAAGNGDCETDVVMYCATIGYV